MTPTDALLERARYVVLAYGLAGLDPARAVGFVGVDGRLRVVPRELGVMLCELLGLEDVAELVRRPKARALHVVALSRESVAVAELEIVTSGVRGVS